MTIIDDHGAGSSGVAGDDEIVFAGRLGEYRIDGQDVRDKIFYVSTKNGKYYGKVYWGMPSSKNTQDSVNGPLRDTVEEAARDADCLHVLVADILAVANNRIPHGARYNYDVTRGLKLALDGLTPKYAANHKAHVKLVKEVLHRIAAQSRAPRSSKYRCVSKNFDRRFEVRLTLRNGTQKYIGRFADEDYAAKIYDLCALKVYGREAKVNFFYDTSVTQSGVADLTPSTNASEADIFSGGGRPLALVLGLPLPPMRAAEGEQVHGINIALIQANDVVFNITARDFTESVKVLTSEELGM